MVRPVVWIIGGLILAPARAQPPELLADFEQALAEFDQAQAIHVDRPQRARQLYRLAAQRFRSIAATGIVTGALEYNLGNCLLQAGDLGHAILHYRRAERLMPRDPMLGDNLSLARSRCLTAIPQTRGSTVLRNVFFWHYRTSSAARTRAAMWCYALFWAILMVRSVFPWRFLTGLAIACAVVAAAAGASRAVDVWADRNAPDGVVTAMDVVVQKGPGQGYQRQFEQPLQPGVEFTLREKTRNGWWRIELADGKTGWIPPGRAELVPDSGTAW
ncbi:MAG: hypothetical protein ACE5EX_08945 [Phycisphaerae bacterium]